MKVNKYWFFFFLTKIFYMFFAIFVYAKLTTLGDASSYISGSKLNLNNFYYNSTSMMSFFGLMISKVLGSILVHFPFMILSFYGIWYSVKRLSLTNRELFFILLILSFPSFGVWTSIVSKEAVGVFFMGIILGYFIDLIKNKNRNIKLIEYIALYLLLIFKPQYFIAILSIFIFIKLSYFFKLKNIGKLFLFLTHVIIIISLFWYFRDIINELSYTMPKHFTMEAGSTRENTIWLENNDVFYNAPYGMFIAFFGPTINEAIDKPIQLLAFIESSIICIIAFFFISKASYIVLLTKKINILYFSLFNIAVFWLLFVHYPFGVLNAGSGIRYRENFYGFLVVFIFYLYKKIKERVLIEKNSISY
jgi:hypothetical protein